MTSRLILALALSCCALPSASGQAGGGPFASDGTPIVVTPEPLAPKSMGDTMRMLYRNWTTRQGLPQDHIRAIERTRDGFLWVATDAGLARFDGFEFKSYGLREGLGAIAVMSLFETRDGTLWIGTLGGGVSALRDGKIVRTYTTKDGLPSNSATVMGEDDQGCLWVSGPARLLEDRFQPVENLPFSDSKDKPQIQAMHLSSEGSLWISISGEGRGLYQWKDGRWSEAPAPGTRYVNRFCEDASGHVWGADTYNRLWSLEGDVWKSHPAPKGTESYPSSIAAGPDGTVWIASFRSGIRGYRDGKYFTPLVNGEPYRGLEEIVYVSPDGQLWLGTSTQGLYALTPSHLEMETVDDGPENQGANFIGALAEVSSGSYLVGTQGRGFYLLTDGRTERIETEPGRQRNFFVNSLLRRKNGEIWAGSSAGLLRYQDRLMIPWSQDPNGMANAWELCEDPEGLLWVGTGGGSLYQIDRGTPKRVSFGNQTSPVKGMALQGNGTLWVGTRGNGLFCRRDGKWQRYGTANGLPSEVVRVIYCCSDDSVWVGTAGGGLAVWCEDRFIPITTQEGLPDDTVSQITEDAAGRLWLGTNRGLAVLSVEEVERIKSGKPGRVFPRVIDRFDGLISEEFTITPPVKANDGKLVFSTTQGIALLRPEDFRADETTPAVLLEAVRVDGKPMAVKDGGIEVPPGVTRVEFAFTGLHFAAPERLRFRNRLEGLEEDWGTEGTDRSAEYRNVVPGRYRFEVSASTGNGLWSRNPAAVNIWFRPHFWQTGWFRVVAVGAVLGAVAFAVMQRERQRASRRIQQLERQQAVDNERARIARDLHDDVGASLTQVALLSQLARSNLTKRPERAGQHVQEIFDTAKEVTRSLDEIVWAVNPANDTLESFALFLGAFVQNYSHAAGLRCRFDVPDVLPAAPLESSIRHHLYLATKEVMHNVAKHAKADEIRMKLSLETGAFRIVIEDDGQGFDGDAPEAPEADGLINLQNRLKLLGGSCERHSIPGQGTSVAMMVPIRIG